MACFLQRTVFETVGAVLRDQVYAHTPPGEPPEYCTLFNHMVKSGGSTIKDKLEASALADGVAPPGVCAVCLQTFFEVPYSSLGSPAGVCSFKS